MAEKGHCTLYTEAHILSVLILKASLLVPLSICILGACLPHLALTLLKTLLEGPTGKPRGDIFMSSHHSVPSPPVSLKVCCFGQEYFLDTATEVGH